MTGPTRFILGVLAVMIAMATAVIFFPHPAAAQRPTLVCQVVSVHDGDTMRCADGTRIRLAAIDAPEVGACPSYRRCAPGDGQAARRTLNTMAYGQSVLCERTGTSYDRITAFCRARSGADMSCAMLRAGQAVYLPQFDRGGRLARCRR